jgi:hypothetical protein
MIEFIGTFFTITIDYNSSQWQILAQFLTGLRVSSLPLWLPCCWFTNRSLLQHPLSADYHSTAEHSTSHEWVLSLMLRPTISRPVCLGIKRPSGAYDQIFISVWQLRVCWCGALSLTSERVCRLQLLLILASAVILGSESRGARGHIILSQIRDFPFRRLLRLAGLRWRYSTPPPHGINEWISWIHEITVFTEPLPRKWSYCVTMYEYMKAQGHVVVLYGDGRIISWINWGEVVDWIQLAQVRVKWTRYWGTSSEEGGHVKLWMKAAVLSSSRIVDLL